MSKELKLAIYTAACAVALTAWSPPTAGAASQRFDCEEAGLICDPGYVAHIAECQTDPPNGWTTEHCECMAGCDHEACLFSNECGEGCALQEECL
jgi:hypothetical protein